MKTREQLLDVCEHIGACWDAQQFIRRSRHDSAYDVLQGETEWKLWFVLRKLTPAGRRLLAKNLGCQVSDFFCFGVVTDSMYDILTFVRPPEIWDSLARDFTPEATRVIDCCYLAWCKS